MKQEKTKPSGLAAKIKQKAKGGSLRAVWQDWLWIWSFSRGRWLAVTIYTLSGIFASGLGLAAGVVSKYMIDAIVALDLSKLLLYCGLTAGFAVLNIVFSSLNSRFSVRLSIGMLEDVQTKVFDGVMDADWMALSGYPTGDLLSRISSDVDTVANCAVSWLPNVLIQGFTLLSTLAVILYYDPIMALICCASTPILFLISRKLLKKQRQHNKQMRQVRGDMSAFQAETFRNMDTLKSFGVEDSIRSKLFFWQKSYRDTALEHNRFVIRTNVLLNVVGMAVQYGALAYCLWRLWNREILFGTMTFFLTQRASLSSAFSALVGLIPTALSGSVAAERLRQLIELPKEPRPGTKPVCTGSWGVELRDTTVSYRENCPVLTDVTLEAPAGQVVALAGPSGGGKTTLLRLLLGLIRPQSGRLELVAADGSRLPLNADTRQCFAYVPQGNTVIAGTVADNLRLVCSDATEEQMEQALKDACAWDFVCGLPQGLHTPIGEGGKGLSEGQSQRLAIARALMCSAPVMLLDEVTSALDAATEEKVLKNLKNRGLTTIVTTHRPSVLQLCTKAYLVDDGKVRQVTPQELINL